MRSELAGGKYNFIVVMIDIASIALIVAGCLAIMITVWLDLTRR